MGALTDTLFDGTLTLHQPARGQGYRVNVDAVLLAWFAGAKRARRVVDLGAGVGAVALSLLYRDRVESARLVEQDPALVALARANLAANGWAGRAEVVGADVRDEEALGRGSAELVTCNPPYVAPGRGRPPRVAAAARVGDLTAFTAAARRVLGPRGRAAFVYPAGELATLLASLRSAGLEAKRLCLVHARRDEPARVALVMAVPGKKGGLCVEPPFYERGADGPSPELLAILAPVKTRASDRA